MPVVAIAEYIGQARDRVENFNGRQLLYLSWDRHLLFAAPFLLCLTPDTPFGEMVDGGLVPLLQADPDASTIDWNQVQWSLAGQPWQPDWSASLRANGIGHKMQLRFHTPGLNSLCAGADA